MKLCPFCAEEIKDNAIKCKHCGEWLKKDAQAPPELVKAKEIETDKPQPESAAISGSDEEIKRKIEEGLKQCPTCGKWDVYRGFIEDGGQGDWCPHCAKSLQKAEQDKNPQIRSDQNRPWLRFWARHFDYILFAFIVGITLFLIMPRFANKLFSEKNDHIFTLVLILLWTFMEAALLSTWGTTIGKWLLSISVRDQQDKKLTYDRAFSRAMKVYWRGMGIGFPIAYLITQIIAYNKLTKNGITTWDSDDALIVHHGKLSLMKVSIMVFMYVLCLLLII